MADRVGQQLGNYRLVRLLGRGGFAEVYLGEHVRLGTSAAVKVLSYTRLATPEAIADFEQEARTIAHLNHPHIVRVLDYDVEQDIPFLVMDYAPNGTLRQRHPKGSIAPLDTIITYVKQVADALQYAHDQRLIHRDIKPENMLLTENQQVVLSDFGIATITHNTSSQSTEASAGTWPYMAPEQIQGRPRPASDQYALGIVVYEWLCGQPPFQGTAAEIAMQHLQAPLPPLREHLVRCSAQVEQVLVRALAKEARERFASVQAFADALQQAARAKQPASIEVPPAPLGTTLLTYRRHSSYVLSVAWSPDGKRIASGSSDKTVQVWDASTGAPLLTYRGHSSYVVSVAWSPDGKRIASASYDKTVQVWDVSTGTPLLTYQGHSFAVLSVAWSPDGTRIASGSRDNTVQVWDAAIGTHILTYQRHSSFVLSVAWSPNSKRIASGSYDNTVQVWDAAIGTHILTYQRHSSAILYALGAVVGIALGAVVGIALGAVVGIAVGAVVGGMGIVLASAYHTPIPSVAWSPDGTRIASGGYDKTVQVWSAG